MALQAWALAVTMLAAPPAGGCGEERLAALVAEVRSADYRADRAALARLDAILGELADNTLGEYRDYWRGFARWRRALNGFNETPPAADVADDLAGAIAHFRKSLAQRPDWIEPRIGILGCQASQLYLAGKDEAKKAPILKEFAPMFQIVQKDGADNPRALWLIGSMQGWAPPPVGGDFVKARTTFLHALASAWSESAARPAPLPWAPAWGGPENLMSLAYLCSQATPPNKGQALAYAHGAVTAAPEWHYVHDILIPRFEKLPDAPH